MAQEKKKEKKIVVIMKGQMTIIGLIMMFVALVMLMALMPAITESIHLTSGCVTGITITVLNLLPLFFVIAIIIGIVIYATGGETRYRPYG